MRGVDLDLELESAMEGLWFGGGGGSVPIKDQTEDMHLEFIA